MADSLPYELPSYVSPSSLGTYVQCPLKYKYSRVNQLKEPPTQATLMGNFVHDVLESFYGLLEPSDRTVSSLRFSTTKVWAEGEWAERIKDVVSEKDTHGFRWSSWWCLENVFKVEDPASINVGGVETGLNGFIEHVPVKGFIDRWFSMNGSIKISDYKTGKTPRVPYVDDKFVQLMIYATLLAQVSDEPISSVELLYLKDGKTFLKDVNRSEIDSVHKLVTETYDSIVKSFESDDWPAIPTKLCNWCFFKNTVCEYWKKDKK